MQGTNPQQPNNYPSPKKVIGNHQEGFTNLSPNRPLAHYKKDFSPPQVLEISYQVSYSTFSQMLKEIQQQIKQNQEIYNKFLKIQELMKILKQFSKGYKSHSEAVEFLRLITDFLLYCKNPDQYQSQAIHHFSNKYQNQLAQKWVKIRDQSYFYNKGHLKLLNYIVKYPKSGLKEYDHCFEDLQFNLSIEQARKVAAVVKKMCKEDHRAFCYLSNYFYNSCVILDNKGASIQQINKKYLNILGIISKQNKPVPPIKQQPGEFEVHQSYAKSKSGPQIYLNLTNLKTEAEKEQALEVFIMSRSQEALKEMDRFNRIIKEICDRNNGYHYKSEVYITDRKQKKAITRVKEKMLAEIYMQDALFRTLLSFVENSFLPTNLVSHVNQDYSEYEGRMRKLYNQIKDPIPFKVSGILGGKCIFPQVGKINKCCSEIKEEIKKRKNEGIELIEVVNRLTKSNSDLILKILFGTTIAEIHLVADLNLADYVFSQKLDELQRSQFFTPLTQLTILNEDISIDYFTEVRAIINNNINQETNYNEKITFNEAYNHFKNFLNFLPLKFDTKQKHPSEIDVKKMKQEQKRLKRLRKAKVSQKQIPYYSGWKSKYNQLLQNGIFFYEMKKHQEATKNLQQALSLFQSERPFLVKQKQGIKLSPEEEKQLDEYLKNLNYAGVNYAQIGKYQLALSKFNLKQKKQKDKNNLEAASTWNNMGGVYDNMGNFTQALKSHNKCLEILESFKPNSKGCIETAPTIANIGLVYYHMGRYSQAQKQFLRALAIYEDKIGKDCTESALTLNNLGLVYCNMGRYSQALQRHNKCLEIEERVKGKGIAIASPLFNIGLVYSKMGKYQQALQYYNKSLDIQEKINGKGSIGTAQVLNSIGNTFKYKGEYHKALQYYKKCLQIKERINGKDSLDAASALGNVGSAYKHMRNYNQALKCYNKCLEIQEEKKGYYSIEAARTRGNLGSTYNHMGSYDQALKHYNKSLEIQEKIMGKESLGRAFTLRNIGNLYKDMGNYKQALQQLNKCLEIQQRLKGKDSTDTATTLGNIGLVNNCMGKYSDARVFHRQSLKILENINGKGSIDTASTISNIGLAYSHQRRYQQALQCYKECLEIQERIKGKDSIDVAYTLHNQGLTYQQLSINQQALKCYERSLSILDKQQVKPSIYQNVLKNVGRMQLKIKN